MTIQVYFRVNRSVRCTLLGIGGVYLEQTTSTIRNKSLVLASDILCYLIILSSQLPFINTSLIEQTKNMIVCYHNNIENKVCHNSGHATIAAPIGCSVVVDFRQLCGCITHTCIPSLQDKLDHLSIWIGMPTLSCQHCHANSGPLWFGTNVRSTIIPILDLH